MEYVLLEIQTDLNEVMQVATIYRSPNSSFENSLNMCTLIDHICSRSGYKLFLGDFNFPNINWNTWNTVGHLERKFIDTLQKNYLQQHIYSPTRARGSAIPHLLDLIITDESFIENIDFDAPLGKSDHSTIRVSYKVNPITKISNGKPGFSKGNYDGMRNHLKSIRWRDLM